MKYILSIVFVLFLFACEKEQCFECMTIYRPYIHTPDIVTVDRDTANELHGQTGTYVDEFGNVYEYRIVCREK